MKIWVIGRSYPLPINSMHGSFELEQAKMLCKHGNSVTYIACVFHPFRKVKKWGYVNWTEEEVKIHVFSQFYTPDRMKLRLTRFKSYVWSSLLNKVEHEEGLPEVIHIHYPTDITIAEQILQYQKKGVKIICTEHWTTVLRNKIDEYERLQLIKYVNYADAFICVGQPLKTAIHDITKTQRNIYVIPNIVNDVFIPVDNKGTDFKFVAVGTFRPEKQIDSIIRAFSDVYRGNISIKLTIIGGGNKKQERAMKELTKELKIEEQIQFTGKLSRAETASIVAKCNALVCYSQYETFGVPVIEAWACGIPVIATTAVAVREGWDKRLGEQASPNNIEELKEKMEYVRQHISEYNKNYISTYARDNYSENVIYKKIIDLYNACNQQELS